MLFLLMDAHDITTSTLTSMFYVLGKHLERQEQLRQKSLSFGKPRLEYECLEKIESLGWQ